MDIIIQYSTFLFLTCSIKTISIYSSLHSTRRHCYLTHSVLWRNNMQSKQGNDPKDYLARCTWFLNKILREGMIHRIYLTDATPLCYAIFAYCVLTVTLSCIRFAFQIKFPFSLTTTFIRVLTNPAWRHAWYRSSNEVRFSSWNLSHLETGTPLCLVESCSARWKRQTISFLCVPANPGQTGENKNL